MSRIVIDSSRQACAIVAGFFVSRRTSRAARMATILAASFLSVPFASANDPSNAACAASSPPLPWVEAKARMTFNRDGNACLIDPSRSTGARRFVELGVGFDVSADGSNKRCSNAICSKAVNPATPVQHSDAAPRSLLALSMPGRGRVESDGLQPMGTISEPASDLSDADDYLCRVYWRMPHKIDGAGDFSWKDSAAAMRSGRTVCEYAISGMHPDLRESLYALGHRIDEAGINWSFLSAFRDDFRQSIASGFKAGNCGSWHGGSCRTKGWGDGRAADLWISDPAGYPVEDASALLELIDRIGPAVGLSRPMPGADPPHVQVSGDWQTIGPRLHEDRIRRESIARSGR
jgi:hypothetical protein